MVGHANCRQTSGKQIEVLVLVFIRKEPGGVFPGGPMAKTPCSPVQGAKVRSLIRELDLTCHNYRSRTP